MYINHAIITEVNKDSTAPRRTDRGPYMTHRRPPIRIDHRPLADYNLTPEIQERVKEFVLRSGDAKLAAHGLRELPNLTPEERETLVQRVVQYNDPVLAAIARSAPNLTGGQDRSLVKTQCEDVVRHWIAGDPSI